MTPNTSLAELQTITPVTDLAKQVWWLRSAMGKSGTDSVPGPTDINLEALLDIGSTEAVIGLLTEKRSSRAVKLVPATWYPPLFNAAVGDDGRVDAQQYRKVPGFHPEALVSVPTKMPSFAIVHQLLD